MREITILEQILEHRKSELKKNRETKTIRLSDSKMIELIEAAIDKIPGTRKEDAKIYLEMHLKTKDRHFLKMASDCIGSVFGMKPILDRPVFSSSASNPLRYC